MGIDISNVTKTVHKFVATQKKVQNVKMNRFRIAT